MGLLKINSGVNSLGNYTDAAIPLNGIDNNVKSVKTLVNSQWKSWTQGAPEAFQGIVEIDKGKGFVANSTAVVDIPVVDTMLDINDTVISSGLNYLCFPYNGKTILDGILPRVKVSSIKTLLGTWKSWTKGAPTAYQGFNDVNKQNGYVCNVETIYDNYLDNNNRDITTGVRIGTSYTNDINDFSSSNIVEFTPDSIHKSISYKVVPVDTAVPLVHMWIKVNNIVKLIKFPIELTDAKFIIKETPTAAIDRGYIIGNVTETIDNGFLDTVSTPLDNGDLIGSYRLSERALHGTFTASIPNSELNPIIITDTLFMNAMEIMYNIKNISTIPVYKEMYVSINNIKSVIQFAAEYTNDNFLLIKDNVVYSGTFVENINNYTVLQTI